jgi:hypothetical protein
MSYGIAIVIKGRKIAGWLDASGRWLADEITCRKFKGLPDALRAAAALDCGPDAVPVPFEIVLVGSTTGGRKVPEVSGNA